MYKLFFKSFFDLIFSIILILVLSPVILVISCLLALSNRGKVFFLQNRPGLNSKIIKVIKFKTMTDEKDRNGNLLPDGDRITKVGRFIRSLSIDELPQVFNVLKGEMSFVGPRPLMPKYLSLYSKVQLRRHEVKPGITGWAQVNGRNDISWKKKFEMDVWYVDNLSFWLDIKIVFLTVKKVLFKEGVSKQGFATTEAFNGSN